MAYAPGFWFSVDAMKSASAPTGVGEGVMSPKYPGWPTCVLYGNSFVDTSSST